MEAVQLREDRKRCKGDVVIMLCTSAVILVLRGSDHMQNLPLMLQKILFSPAARELALSLERVGVERFFVISEADLLRETAACFPAGAQVVSAQAEDLDRQLMAFAAQATGKVLTVTAPVWISGEGLEELTRDEFITPAGDPMGVYRVEPEVLAEGGVETLNYGEYYSPLNEPEIQLLPLKDYSSLRKARELARVDNLCRLMAAGAEIIDPSATYAEGGAEVGLGTTILPGTLLRGCVKVGQKCEIGPHTTLQDCVVEDGCTVNASQVEGVTLPAGCVVGPFAHRYPGSEC